MSGRIVYAESPVAKYGDRLANLREDIHGYVAQLISDAAVVRRSDVPNRASVVAAYDAAVAALRAAVDALGTHSADVKKYVALRQKVEEIYKSLQPVLKNLPEIEAAQRQAQEEALFGGRFWVDSVKTAWDVPSGTPEFMADQLTREFSELSPVGKAMFAQEIALRVGSGDTTLRGAWLEAVSNSPGGAFAKSMSNFGSVVEIVIDAHHLAVDHQLSFDNVQRADGIVVSASGLVGAGGKLLWGAGMIGSAEAAPAWVTALSGFAATGGAITGGIAIGVPIGLYMEGRYEQFEGQGINGWTHIAKNDPIVLVPADEVGYAWHKTAEAIGTAVFGTGGNYKPGTYLPNDQLQVVMNTIHAQYPDAHVVSEDGALRVVIPDHLGGWATMLTVDIKTGATR